jgi:uncharacterized protein YqgC (DUF456 family)
MRSKAKKAARLFFGWGFILVGIVGLFLPFLPGMLSLIVGLLILSLEYVWANHFLQQVRARFPVLSSHLDEAAIRAYKWTGEGFRHTQPGAGSGTTNIYPQ